MASYNTVITNEGAALLASVIANQGTLTFSEMRFSTNDYDGVEATLTVGTFAGVFITAAASGSVVDATTIKVGAQFDNSGIVGDHPLYSIGIVGTDGNTTALIAVCTTTNPDIIRAALTGVSTYAFNVNLSVSSTSNITVAGTTAAVLYDTDVVDNLTSIATNKPLSANQGRLIADNLAANEAGGAKNLNSYPYYGDKVENGITWTVNPDGSVTVSGIATGAAYIELHNRLPHIPNTCILKAGTYILTGGLSSKVRINIDQRDSGGSYTPIGTDYGSGLTFTIVSDVEFYNAARIGLTLVVDSGTDLSTPVTIYPMIRDARVIDPTFVPYAKTNLQLTNDVASIFDILPNNAGAHNHYRGKALTIDADFWAHISDGTFENQFVGDTITLNGRKYTLAHANYWLHTGDTACETNHWVVISPNMGNAQMNSDNSTAGGYLGSGFRSGTNHDSTPNTALASALATIKSDFGASHILSHRELLDNAVTGGYPSSGTWVDSEAELMSQIMAYGNRFFDPSTNLGVTIPYLSSIDKSQLALYAQRPDLLTDRSRWWLRDVVSAANFAYVYTDGGAYNANASNSLGVRLAFGIIA